MDVESPGNQTLRDDKLFYKTAVIKEDRPTTSKVLRKNKSEEKTFFKRDDKPPIKLIKPNMNIHVKPKPVISTEIKQPEKQIIRTALPPKFKEIVKKEQPI